jgi:crotonobetainyl-CoA:carnitine CoA-transferase CaiB-like acyl-CoA transferase
MERVPALGEDNAAVLAELGYAPEDVADLHHENAV